MIAILEWMFFGWFFWPFSVAFLVWAYCEVRHEKYDFSYAAGTFTAIACAGIMYRYDYLRHWLWDSEHATWAIIAYILIGFFIAFYKWTGRLFDFRRAAPEYIATIPADYKPGSTSAMKHVSDGCDLPYSSVCHSAGRGYYLNWRKFPLANWWAYWPFFILSVVFDPIRRSVRWAVDVMKKFRESMALRFAVK